jgi:branched-subunit amino acid ABC-type transport system permease component
MRLINQRRRLERVIFTLGAEVVFGQAVQLVVDERHHLVERVSIAAGEGKQQLRGGSPSRSGIGICHASNVGSLVGQINSTGCEKMPSVPRPFNDPDVGRHNRAGQH